ncbi:hypothetical protein K438DRAFT_1771215 [Mycena galopus ATCC 62051]|nr:hypothetical protein K438DRAFT_1771215 [Mycena galopus ATCC 62051]
MAPQKHPKLRRALKLPFHGRAATTASGRNAFAPRAGEQPIVYLRVQILGGIICRRRIGMGSTPVAKKTLNPGYAPKDATWDCSIYASIADKLGVVELVVWDKDMLRKDYLGEARIAVEDWFTDSRPKAWDAPGSVSMLSASERRRSRSWGWARGATGSRAWPACTGNCASAKGGGRAVERDFSESREDSGWHLIRSFVCELHLPGKKEVIGQRGKAVKSKTMKAREVKDVSNSKSKPKPKSEQKADEEKEEAEGKRREMRLGAAMIDSVMLDF